LEKAGKRWDAMNAIRENYLRKRLNAKGTKLKKGVVCAVDSPQSTAERIKDKK
jgi:hypothetical protein